MFLTVSDYLKTFITHRNATTEKDRATTSININFGEVWPCGFSDVWVYRQTDTPITLLRIPFGK